MNKGEWRKLHNGELHNLYSSPDIIRQIESRRMRWAITLIMEAVQTSEILVNSYQSTWRYNPEHSHLQNTIKSSSKTVFPPLSFLK
jgi:hypothetical protein